ncbi:MAG: MBL fold metallo-hydrolase [Coriobacteriia bacterium]|nr:MBL fold metallo-hydrolase [Coriobacteriia bacterium]
MRPTESAEARLTIVYDNDGPVSGSTPTDPALRTGWGFSCFVEAEGIRLLFDTGGDGPTLLGNMAALGVDSASIDILVLSHEHSDHVGGLSALLDEGARPVAYVPRSFSAAFRETLSARIPVVEVSGPTEIVPGVRTTGEVGSAIVEQSLVLETGEGLVLITGCAHPGIVEIVRSVAESGSICLAVGGFHLKDQDVARCHEVAGQLRALGVGRVAPTHCTGETGVSSLEAGFGDRCIRVGLGSRISIGVGERPPDV